MYPPGILEKVCAVVTRFFLDTEFIESGYGMPVSLLSVGLVCENGREYYAENIGAPFYLANDFVKEKVIPKMSPLLDPQLMPSDSQRLSTMSWRYVSEIKAEILAFIAENLTGPDDRPEFWANFADYDWVVLCSIFGRMVDLPPRYPKYCLDLKQWSEDLKRRFRLKRAPRCPASQGPQEHNAVNDARWDLTYYRYLAALEARLEKGDLTAADLER